MSTLSTEIEGKMTTYHPEPVDVHINNRALPKTYSVLQQLRQLQLHAVHVFFSHIQNGTNPCNHQKYAA